MSKETGVEFARVTIGDKEILIRGNKSGAIIPASIIKKMEKERGTLDFHSHPFDDDNVPSVADYKLMTRIYQATGQRSSEIVTPNGRITVYSGTGVIETGTVSNLIDNEMKSIYNKLFGGD